MLKEFVKFIQEQKIKPEERKVIIDDRNFVIDTGGTAREIKPEFGRAQRMLEINTLSGLVNYIKSKKERVEKNLFLQVYDEKTVLLKSTIDADGGRETIVSANVIVPEFYFETFLDTEKLNIALQSQFLPSPDREIILQVIGNIREEAVKTTGDDGISQKVAIKTGVATVGDVKVPNPVTLIPYRTFLEVAQPESQFVFRMKEGPQGALFEADGGAWRNQAIVNVREYLNDNLADEIKNGHITVIA